MRVTIHSNETATQEEASIARESGKMSGSGLTAVSGVDGRLVQHVPGLLSAAAVRGGEGQVVGGQRDGDGGKTDGQARARG